MTSIPALPPRSIEPPFATLSSMHMHAMARTFLSVSSAVDHSTSSNESSSPMSTSSSTSSLRRLPSLFGKDGESSPRRVLGMQDVLNHQQQYAQTNNQQNPVNNQPLQLRLPSLGALLHPASSSSSTSTISPVPKSSPEVERYPVMRLEHVHHHDHHHSHQDSPVSPVSPLALHHHAHCGASSPLSPTDSSTSSPRDKPKRATNAKLCGVQGCTKRAKAGGRCIAHGGGLRCSEEDCTKHAVSLGLCISHGGGKRCTIEGCLNASRKNGVCWSHGGKRLCKMDGCTKGPKSGGYCWSHGGKQLKKAD